ncbi:HNH endonuclease signature motif containing protein [Methylobacterium sp. R2-1]|uniref:HNH endonuclease signature motif containing protein n=1 Tax=Methylobacterium sp. R2-1 TaxID=2587064 RepID=UPI00160EF74D|nr:HNH endonuclease signature motif containing protein [Methylobacterium sp. R2-1]MBB2965207.1 5-methylcytosine-specific restriction endonuclease McrA [Methylobacterium sp. R2-1]
MARLPTLPPRLCTVDMCTARPPARTWADRKASEPRQGFYQSPEWRALRDGVTKQRGKRCEDCGRTGTRIYCDHIVELQDGGAGLDETNIRLRCGSCHTRKTANARARRHGLR